jgi:hypothetical protein
MSNYNYYPSGGAPSAQSSTMAIISLIAGILGLTFIPIIGSIVALILGYMAKNEIRASGGALSGDGMATAGIILGWVGMVFLCLGLCLAGVFVLLPACLIPLGLSTDYTSSILPVVFQLFI